jgi:ArsR family transcriptional regulator, nickel/cobalt-responsive transcriptional repressor
MAHGVEGRITPTQITLDVAREVAQTIQALATTSRVRILGRLCESPCTVGQLAEAIQMEQSAVSHQLRTLRHLGLVVGDRQGRNVLYALHDDHVATLLEEAVFHVEHLHLGVSDSATAR